MGKTVALVVDVQEGIVSDSLYNKDVFLNTLKESIDYLRIREIEIIYIRHQDEIGDALEYGKPGWEIYHEVKPLSNEKIFDKERNSAFRNTELKEYLNTKEVDTIILMGLQTDYCMDATCKVAFEYGYTVYVVENTNTTEDNIYMNGKTTVEFYNQHMWPKRYATIISLEKMKELY